MAWGDAPRLAVIKPAPAFALTNQAGEPVRSSDLNDKVVLVSFIFTTCNGSCPATTSRMLFIHKALQERGLFKEDKVRLLSITLDPVRDTPEALRNYKRLYDIDSPYWSFLTGPREQVEKTIADWGMWARPAANGQLDHPSRIFLMDRQGRIREIYDLSFLRTPWVVEDMEMLLKEGK